MKMIYNVEDKPGFGQTLVFAFQQILAILAATIAVPAIIGNDMSASAALFGAGVGTIVYLLFTKFKSPVFLGSSFAFIGSMFAAFAGGVSMSLGYLGLILGACFAGLVYVLIAIVVKFVGVGWVNRIMPAVVIGPTVAIIGLSLAGNAIGDLTSGNVKQTVDVVTQAVTESGETVNIVTQETQQLASGYLCLGIGLVTLFVTMFCSVYGKKMLKMIPFIIGICAGYVIAAVCTVIGTNCGIDALMVIDFSKFQSMKWVPDFTFLTAFSGNYEFGNAGSMAAYIGTIAVAYVPVAFVVFAEHIADHKNLSSIIERDLLKDPGLSRTLLGDGIGSAVGSFFGGCPNTTYGESVGCVAISGNASVVTIVTTAILCIVFSFVGPFVTFLATIPSCVMGGICIALYGFIAVSGLKMIQTVDLDKNRNGLKMIQHVDLNENSNLFTVSVILIAGIGGLEVTFGAVTITEVAAALILGILANVFLHNKKEREELETEL